MLLPLFMAVDIRVWIGECQRTATVVPRPSACSRPWRCGAAAGKVERDVSFPLALADTIFATGAPKSSNSSQSKFVVTSDPYPNSPWTYIGHFLAHLLNLSFLSLSHQSRGIHCLPLRRRPSAAVGASSWPSHSVRFWVEVRDVGASPCCPATHALSLFPWTQAESPERPCRARSVRPTAPPPSPTASATFPNPAMWAPCSLSLPEPPCPIHFRSTEPQRPVYGNRHGRPPFARPRWEERGRACLKPSSGVAGATRHCCAP